MPRRPRRFEKRKWLEPVPKHWTKQQLERMGVKAGKLFSFAVGGKRIKPTDPLGVVLPNPLAGRAPMQRLLFARQHNPKRPRKGSIRELFESFPVGSYQRDLRWIRASNNALRSMPGSLRQREFQAEMARIEAECAGKSGRKRNPLAVRKLFYVVTSRTNHGRVLYLEKHGKLTGRPGAAKKFPDVRHAVHGAQAALRHRPALRAYRFDVRLSY